MEEVRRGLVKYELLTKEQMDALPGHHGPE
jgi:hypothetical protein